jgi:hypothetical protein
MGNAGRNKDVEAKKKETRKWDRESLTRTLMGVLEAKKGKDIYHVISYDGDRWGVFREGCKRVHKIHDNKRLAVAHAKQLARRSLKWSVVIHKEDATPEKYIHSDR